MPGYRGKRNGRGGPREGKARTAYGARTDLNGPQPIRAAPGGQYGAAKASEDAQRAVPMGTPDVAPAAPGGAPAPAFSGMPPGMTPPGALGDLFADSENPEEDVMNGARLGPGAGPEAFGLGQARRQQDMVKLQRALAAWEEVAARPNATNATRAFVRNVKAQIIGMG